MSELAALQERFYRSIDEGGGQWAPRLDVHASMWRSRLVDALAEELPSVRAVIGDERFEGLVRSFLRAHPSSSPTLQALGAPFATFVAGHAIGREFGEVVDLAKLDRARAEAADAANVVSLGPDAIANASFVRTPSTRILVLDHDVIAAWRAADRGAAIERSKAARTAVLVWRGPGFVVRHRAIDALEERAIDRLCRPASLAALCTELTIGREVEDAISIACGFILQWLADELLTAV
jgi:hypothetical protein